MNAEVLREFFDALGSGDFDLIRERLHDDVTFEFPGRRFGGTFAGKRAVTVFMRQNQRLFQGGLRFHVSWADVVGDRGVAQWTNEGTTSNGVKYGNRGVTVFRLDGDRILTIQDYLDTEMLSETWPARESDQLERSGE